MSRWWRRSLVYAYLQHLASLLPRQTNPRCRVLLWGQILKPRVRRARALGGSSWHSCNKALFLTPPRVRVNAGVCLGLCMRAEFIAKFWINLQSHFFNSFALGSFFDVFIHLTIFITEALTECEHLHGTFPKAQTEQILPPPCTHRCLRDMHSLGDFVTLHDNPFW